MDDSCTLFGSSWNVRNGISPEKEKNSSCQSYTFNDVNFIKIDVYQSKIYANQSEIDVNKSKSRQNSGQTRLFI